MADMHHNLEISTVSPLNTEWKVRNCVENIIRKG